jgi:hypothetical protein
MINSFFYSNFILKIIKLFSHNNLDKQGFSENLCLNIQKFIKNIIIKTLKYMKINRKIKMTISDIKNANLDNSEIKFINNNQTVLKIFNKKFNFNPQIKIYKHLIDYKIKKNNFNNGFFFILKNWYLFNFENSLNLNKKKLNLSLISKFKKQKEPENLAFFLLLNKEFIFYRYILTKLENGNYIEKDFCLEMLSKYKKINTIIPHIILYLNGYMDRYNNSFFRLRLAIKIIRALIINKFSCIIKFVDLILPILLKCILDTSEKFDTDETYSLKIYAANIISITYNRIGFQRSNFFLKIIPIFCHIIASFENNISELYGSLLTITVLGLKSTELLLFPYLLKIVKFLKSTMSEKNNESFKLIETKQLCILIKTIILSYCIKKKINVSIIKKNKLIKKILGILTKLKKISISNSK